jgi:hypothetical protein
MEVKNNATAIEKALHLDAGSCKHEGNFQFSATLNGHRVLVNTEPVDDEQENINIYSMEL